MTPQQVSEILGCSVGTVRAMLRDGLLPGKKVAGTWRVTELEVAYLLKLAQRQAPEPEIKPEIIEVTVALSALALGILALLPGVSDRQQDIRVFVVLVAALAGILAILSAYSSLWLLARYCLGGDSLTGLQEILALLGSLEVRPYWFVALSLLIWMLLSILLVALVIIK